MIFSKFPDGALTYLFHYIPAKTGRYDARSKIIILDALKCGPSAYRSEWVNKLALSILPYILSECVAISLPSSSVHNFDNGVQELVKRMAQLSHKVIDGSNCVHRQYDVEPAHNRIGKRTEERALEGLILRNSELFKDKNVIVFDDVTTSGSSLNAVIKLVKKCGAQKVIGLAIAKTIGKEYFERGFIFDLDQTLFDTSSIKKYRKKGHWKEALLHVNDAVGDDRLIEFVKEVNNQGNLCVVTSSPIVYAKYFTQKLGISDKYVVAYHDTQLHKPYVSPYVLAKSILQKYESNIYVVGDSLNDLYPAYRMGMKTIYAGWWADKNKGCSIPEFPLDYSFNTVADFLAVFKK